MNRLLWLVLLCVSSLFGCGGSYVSAMRRTVYVASEALRSSDELAANEYRKAARAAREQSHDLEEYRRRIVEWDELEIALRAAHLALLGAEAGLDVYEETGNKKNWRDALACASAVFEDLYGRFEDLVPEAPDAIMDAIALFKGEEGKCNEGR